MAETVVSIVIDKLGPLLVEEINLLRGVSKDIEDIKTELESIRYFLKDAEAKAATEELQGSINGRVQQWVSQVREVAYSIEDVIDEFTFTVAQLPHGKGLVGVFQKFYRSIKKLKLRQNIAHDIQEIRSSLVQIDDRRKRYGLNSIDEGSSSETTHVMPSGGYVVGSYFMEEDQIVGYESLRKELDELLVNKIAQRKVIALVGAGGLGKTTLAASSFKKDDVKCHFNCHAWVYVGRTYNKDDLLRKIIQRFCSSLNEPAPVNIKTMDEIELTDLLRKYLENKSYMVVFDDVWREEFWEDVEHALPDNNKSNRLIITTRKMEVAQFIPGDVNIPTLEGLLSDKAWELFNKKAFSPSGFCPPDLEELSRRILEKCRGLPLAIVAVAGLLSKKKKIATEWKNLLNNLGSELGSDPHLKSCNRVLSEGYNDLPHHLKPCLLYFGLFPESYSISYARLIRLWTAEGFVKSDMRKTSKRLEEIGEGYLAELTQRSLVLMSEKDFGGKVRKFRVHDMIHEIIYKKTEQLGFSRVIDKYDMSQGRKSRRLTVSACTDNVFKRKKNFKVRSLFLFQIDELPKSFMNTFVHVADFRLISVVDFEDAPIDYIPEEVGNLFHLHYLSLKNTKVKILPKSIGKLVNLETLDLKKTLVSEFPVEIKNLKRLRYLIVYHRERARFSYGEGAKIEEGIGSLEDLQKLGYVRVNSKVVEELRKLSQLKKLGILLVHGHGEDLWSAISNMKDLNSFGVEMINKEETLDIQSMVSPPKYLEHLYLRGTLKNLPDWISHHQYLVKLFFCRSRLTDDPMEVLHTLPNLLELEFVYAYDGERLHIKAGWFPKLKSLFLFFLKGLKVMEIENGAMPALDSLRYGPCPLLKDLPTGIGHLRNLKFLMFYDMLEEIKSGLITYDNWEKIKHIPNIFVRVGMSLNYLRVKEILDQKPEFVEEEARREGQRKQQRYKAIDNNLANADSPIVRWAVVG